jgi:hypothetical protein
MTKSPHKIMLRKETLRALNTMELTHVVGGAASGTLAAGGQTNDGTCPRQQDIVIPGK